MRRRILTSAGTAALSAKSYVQDGLVALWDGIENAGWGVHDGSATVWAELCGNYVQTSGEAKNWDGVSLVCNKDTRLLFGGFFGFESLTVETIVQCDELYNNSYIIDDHDHVNKTGFASFVTNLSDPFGIRFSYGVAGNTPGYSYSTPTKPDASLFAHGSLVCDSAAKTISLFSFGRRLQTIQNGSTVVNETQAFAIAGNNTNNTNSFLGRIMCIRVYSRSLSEIEILRNLDVDRARFGIGGGS